MLNPAYPQEASLTCDKDNPQGKTYNGDHIWETTVATFQRIKNGTHVPEESKCMYTATESGHTWKDKTDATVQMAGPRSTNGTTRSSSKMFSAAANPTRTGSFPSWSTGSSMATMPNRKRSTVW